MHNKSGHYSRYMETLIKPHKHKGNKRDGEKVYYIKEYNLEANLNFT